MIVYKYLEAARIDVLENSCIRFTQPDALNDIFDTNPSEALFVVSRRIREIRGLTVGLERLNSYNALEIAEAIAANNEARGASERRKHINGTNAVLCLSHTHDNLLMWSHYTRSHTGFVIGFDTDYPFFKAGNGRKIDLKGVDYSKKRPEIPQDGLDRLNDADFEKAIIKIIFTKSIDWAYEKEVRLVVDPKYAYRLPGKDSTPEKDTSGFDICLFRFPSECVREIIFGYRMPPDVRENVLQAAKNYPNAKVFEAIPDDLEYKMRIIRHDAE